MKTLALTCTGGVYSAVGQGVDRDVGAVVGRIGVYDFDGFVQLHGLGRRIVVGQRRINDMLLLLLLANEIRLADARH